jgi:hypothetical protein
LRRVAAVVDGDEQDARDRCPRVTDALGGGGQALQCRRADVGAVGEAEEQETPLAGEIRASERAVGGVEREIGDAAIVGRENGCVELLGQHPWRGWRLPPGVQRPAAGERGQRHDGHDR